MNPHLHKFEADQFEASLLKATHDFSHQLPLHAIRLHGDEGALVQSGPTWRHGVKRFSILGSD